MVSLADTCSTRARVRQTVPSRLEALTEEYDSLSEPLRVALNTVLAASADKWPETLFACGLHLKPFDLSDGSWRCYGRPAWNAPDEEWGQRAVLEIARAASAGDRGCIRSTLPTPQG